MVQAAPSIEVNIEVRSAKVGAILGLRIGIASKTCWKSQLQLSFLTLE